MWVIVYGDGQSWTVPRSILGVGCMYVCMCVSGDRQCCTVLKSFIGVGCMYSVGLISYSNPKLYEL